MLINERKKENKNVIEKSATVHGASKDEITKLTDHNKGGVCVLTPSIGFSLVLFVP